MRPGTNLLLAVVICMALTTRGRAGDPIKRPFAPVPPELEIEILDPGVDPLGNPAVVVKDGDRPGDLSVDIPPTVMVHRYYYTGDRSFQAQILPGGPSVVVVNHPRTGEQVYIPVQMLPGAPRVTYTGNSIHYDFGGHGITIKFGLLGKPCVKYRSGKTWRKRMGELTHADELRKFHAGASARTQECAQRSADTAYGAAVVVTDTAKTVLTPVAQIARVLPFGAALFSGDLEKRLTERGLAHKRETANRCKIERDERAAADYSTIRGSAVTNL
jgi:hypothetical protein